MFRVTPVPESGARKVSFSPDIDESYRHQVVDKIQGLMKEVEGIHIKEETQMHSFQETQARDFKLKQESDLQAFMKKQKAEQSSFHSNQTNDWNNLKERHTQDTWKLFGRSSSSRPAEGGERPTIHNMWEPQPKKSEDSSYSSPCFSPKPASETSNTSWSSRNSQATSPTNQGWRDPWEPSTKWNPTGRDGRQSGARVTSPDYWNT